MASRFLDGLKAKPIPRQQQDIAVKIPKQPVIRVKTDEEPDSSTGVSSKKVGEIISEEIKKVTDDDDKADTLEKLVMGTKQGITVKDKRETFDQERRDNIVKRIRAQQQTVVKAAPKTTVPVIADTTGVPLQPIGEDLESRVEDPSEQLKPSIKKTITIRKPGTKKKKKRKMKLSGTITDSTTATPKIRLSEPPKEGVINETEKTLVTISSDDIRERLPEEEEKVIIRSDSYYMNNREIFSSFINSLLQPYREELQDESSEAISCAMLREAKTGKFALLPHQKIVRDYLNVYTPYRGLLLYHGLGSGKTCTSIAIAEGLKTSNQVLIMTPASLRANYIKQLKECGDSLYKKNQYWEFVETKANPDIIPVLAKNLSIGDDYIKKNGGAWLVNIKKESNFETLPTAKREEIDLQINEMIRSKYRFINYNGLRNSHLGVLTNDFTENPFDNKVVIIDEAHNFISRIVNKLKKEESLSMRLYEYLLSAQNVRIVLLTGTPIINYPNEIGILFNILRGYIKTWTFRLNIKTGQKIDAQRLRDLFEKNDVYDYLDYKPSGGILTVTRNPFGFASKLRKGKDKKIINKGVQSSEKGVVSDADFQKKIIRTLAKIDIEVFPVDNFTTAHKALPDDMEGFKNLFIEGESGNIKNMDMFKRRVLGLTSYFKSAQEKLLPRYVPDRDLQVIKIPMSDYQFGVYEAARADERRQETNNAKRRKKGGDKVYDDTTSTYRIFSRAFCNFAFPKPPGRPFPKEGEDVKDALEGGLDEDAIDATPTKEKIDNPDGRFTADDAALLEQLEKESLDSGYEGRINSALQFLRDNAEQTIMPEALKTYSPKFLTILENLQDVDLQGIHLIYSQFRTLEGIGILKVILEANGFAQLKIRKNAAEQWVLDVTDEDMLKPKFALYTGTESAEEKDIILNITNSTWENVPSTITDRLLDHYTNNHLGEIVKVFMITSSGSEGIDMRNVRYVHIVEPYWHPVRSQQVIGRARRICSHEDLPEELRTVNVFMYLMTFTEEQLTSDSSIELRLKDKSKIDKKTPLTSDEALFEISNIKEDINRQILKAIKESAMDCSVHSSSKDGEPLVCYSISSAKPNKFSYSPSISNEESDTITAINRETVKWRAKKVTIDGKSFAFRKETSAVYDLDSYMQAIKTPGVNPIKIGTLEFEGKKARLNRMAI